MFIGVTVKTVESEMPLQVAVIVVVPAANEVANPIEPAVLTIVAIDCDDEVQLATFVNIRVVLSENVPVAMNCCVAPRAMFGLAGVTVMEESVAEVTLRVAELDIMLPDEAVIVVLPVATAVANPVLSIVATAVV